MTARNDAEVRLRPGGYASTTSAQTVPAALSQFPGASQFQQPTGSIAAAAIIVPSPS